ncbi:GNAT family N-acetyltransferase [Pararhodospirillum oryzae]|uniref:N-acetyltransferase domain-containing protein n=1 Tax=Pararhodospirillum oryzae TaxID=478448 RepID=A0A512H4W1_9PROT|nr:GNAT family N-acetyltransferase [Pararhodospirillum oryzae]GEO80420.1 hypothetical protein ROR02_05510 [Pararhodospirillum oryzae]
MITLSIVEVSERAAFKKHLQEAFAVAVIETFGSLPDGPIPSDDDLDQSFASPGAEALHVLDQGRKVGGAIVTINQETHRNTLDLFFIKLGEHGHGLGLRAWQAIERRYPDTRVWETHTPLFETRNIHFYVNKCGFKIVEFFNPHHPNPHGPGGDDLPGEEADFRFEKVM